MRVIGAGLRLIDTGGVDEADTGPYGKLIAQQAKTAVAEADLVLFVVDARAGVTPGKRSWPWSCGRPRSRCC